MKINCRYFSGYKPCPRSNNCDKCHEFAPVGKQILLIHLGAIGAVLRSTSLLPVIHQQFPGCHLTWVTEKPSHLLLAAHPLIDQVITTNFDELLQLKGRNFDLCYVIDKSQKAIGIADFLDCQTIRGFQRQIGGTAIVPATAAAEELWQLGLSNQKKFFENNKSEVQLVLEALELMPTQTQPVAVPEYCLPLTDMEQNLRRQRQQAWRRSAAQPIIGINTGCSEVMPAKKLTIDFQRKLIERLILLGYRNLVLLGGPEDSERNRQIAQGLDVIESSCVSGIRDGLVSVASCDLVITGDSLGMHMAISQKCFTIAWFGPTCEQEIELYGRGIKILSAADCRPCWKRSCDKSLMCYNQVEIEQFLTAVEVGTNQWAIENRPAPFLRGQF